MRLRATLAAGSQTEALGTAGPSEAATGAGQGEQQRVPCGGLVRGPGALGAPAAERRGFRSPGRASSSSQCLPSACPASAVTSTAPSRCHRRVRAGCMRLSTRVFPQTPGNAKGTCL